MTMRKILILIFCLFAAPLWAGSADALLDNLALAKTKSDADSIVRSIWIEWLGAYESDRERQLMDKGIGAMDKKTLQTGRGDFHKHPEIKSQFHRSVEQTRDCSVFTG